MSTGRKAAERVVLIETAIGPNDLVKLTDARGHGGWFCRIAVTGLYPRRYGPFESKGRARLFLDRALDSLLDALVTDVLDGADRYAPPGRTVRMVEELPTHMAVV